MTAIRTDRTFSAQLTPGQPGEATPSAAWGQRSLQFLDRGNELAVGNRTLDASGMRRILQQPTAEARQTLARELLGQPGLDWGDFRRFADDVMTANPNAAGQRFAVDPRTAQRNGIVDRDGFDRAYGGGRMRLTTSPRTPTEPATPAAPPPDPQARLMQAPALRNAPSAVQNAATQALGNADPARAEALTRLVEARGFGGLNRPQQEQVLHVAEEADTRGLGALRQLVERRDAPLLGHALGGNHQTMLDSLSSLSRAQLSGTVDARGPAARRELISGILDETANRGHINQGDNLTCATTAGEFALARRSPAEYARVVTSLATNGSAQLADGQTLVQARLPAQADRPNSIARSLAEELYQTSVGRHFNGNSDGAMTSEHFGEEMSAVLGHPFAVNARGTDHGASLLTEVQESSQEHRAAFVRMDWATGTGGHAHHFLALDRVEDGRVYLRNPWGAGSGWNVERDVRPDVHVRVERGDNGLVSVSLADFQQHAHEVISAE